MRRDRFSGPVVISETDREAYFSMNIKETWEARYH